MHTMHTFSVAFIAAAGAAPKAADFYYHEECSNSGAACSVHELDDGRFLRAPTDGGDMSVTAEDIRGQDRAA